MRNIIAVIIGPVLWYLSWAFVTLEFPLRFTEWQSLDRAFFLYFFVATAIAGFAINQMRKS